MVEVKRRRYARLIATRAIKAGGLKKPACCDLCSLERNDIEAHHVDYGDPLRINWLCRKCHGLAHREGHELNPKAYPQTPMPAAMEENEKIVVSTLVPIDVFLALRSASKAQNKPIAAIIREKIIQSYPIESQQLDLFEDKHDRTQNEPVKRIRSMEKNEKLLLKSEIPLLPPLRRHRSKDLPRMEQQLFSIFNGYGSNSSGMQWACSS